MLALRITQRIVSRRSASAASAAAGAVRHLHMSGPVCGHINTNARMAGTTRTQLTMSKRMSDRVHEEASLALPPVFASADAFHQQIDASFTRLSTGLADMIEANSSMKLIPDAATHSLEVSLGDKGSFMFHSDADTQRLSMFTPQTGETHRYRWDRTEGRWVADSDGHALEELFVRDIISTGLLSFPQL